jgi:hypothetical protein
VTKRLLIVLLVAAGLSGCAHPRIPTPDSILTALGFPKRGFVTDTMFPDDGAPATSMAPAARTACTPKTCSQAAQYCAVRGYRPGTDGFGRCLVSVEQNLRDP